MKSHSIKWKASTSRRKQRKYQKAAPLHVKAKLMHSTLSKELRKKNNTRSVQVRKGDKVKVMRGNFKGKTGKVESANVKHNRVFISKLEVNKKDGTKANVPFRPSNLKIIELNTGDKRRLKNKAEQKTGNQQQETSKVEQENQNGQTTS